MNGEEFGEDELIILGSGGGRFQSISQDRSTGSLIFRPLNKNYQFHIDPGRGAIRDLRNYKINPRDTTHIFLAHNHTDHAMSIPIIIEGMSKYHASHNPK
jgi:ribonuclease BN (tRNA processing enzyme)